MLKFNLNRIFKARGINRPFSYLVKKGYSSNFASRIANSGMKQINLKQMERICETLHCTPNDILEWTPDHPNQDLENHHLTSLKRTNIPTELTKMLNSIPLDKLQTIETLIKEEIKK